MTPAASVESGPLVWKQGAATQRHYELRVGDAVVAELEFLKTFGTLARGRAASGAWTFKRMGFLSPIVTARREGESEDCALYHPNFSLSQGQLRLSTGEGFEFRMAGIWTRSAILIDNDRREVFRIHLKGDPGAGAAVEVRLPQTPSLELLLLFCWYVLVLQMQDESLRSAAR